MSEDDVRRSFRLTIADAGRIERLRDRCGPRTKKAEAVRVAILWFVAHAGALKARVPEAVASLEHEFTSGEDMPGAVLLQHSESQSFDSAIMDVSSGVFPPYTRTLIIRTALLFIDRADDADVRAIWEALPKFKPGSKPKTPAA